MSSTDLNNVYKEIPTTYCGQPISPKVEESPMLTDFESKAPKQKLLSWIDTIEKRVDTFRHGALSMEDERDFLFSSLDAVRTSDFLNEMLEDDRRDILDYLDRLTMRCVTVELNVRTVRNEQQEESLYKVNGIIDNLIEDIRDDPFKVKDRCVSFMDAISSKSSEDFDRMFEQAVLGCALDDQKRIKRRLRGLLDYINFSNLVDN